MTVKFNKTKLTRMKKAELIEHIEHLERSAAFLRHTINTLENELNAAQDNAIPFEQPTPKPQPTLKPNQKIVQKWGISFIETNHGKYVSHVRA